VSWLRLDDSYPEHPKLASLTDSAFRAHVRCMAYCARHLTDGYVPASVVREYAGSVLGELTATPRIGSSSLLEECDGGFMVHDYLDYNPTREKVLADRKREADRKAAQRHGGCPGGTPGGTTGGTPDVPYPYPSLDLKTSRTLKDKPLSPPGLLQVLGYLEGKLGRTVKAREVSSVKTLLKRYSPDVVCTAIGQACAQGESATNFALITTICKAEVAA
jgi:hypothetical protein